MNLKQFQEHINNIGTTLDPGDDWMPVLFLEKDKTIAVIGMLLMENDQTKKLCAAMLKKIVSMTNPDSACFITTAWMAHPDARFKDSTTEEFEEAYRKGYVKRPSEDPNRIEIVSAVCMGVSGENDGEAFMIGEIERFPDKPPKIKKWDIHDDEDLKLTGRFADAIREGFESVDKTGDLSRLEQLKGILNKWE